MTTETSKASDAPRDDEEQSFLPTVLAGAGILAVAALLIFWPSDDAEKGGSGKDGKTASSQSAGGGGAGGAGSRAAGVAARPSDAPTTQPSRKINPAIKLPETRGMAPTMPEPAPTEPPADATVDEQIAFWEGRLEAATRMRDNRKKFYDRLPALEERIKSSPNPEQSMETFERRKQIVQDNYDKAKAEVERIEGKLAELRG